MSFKIDINAVKKAAEAAAAEANKSRMCDVQNMVNVQKLLLKALTILKCLDVAIN
jgi:hypothetical protein